MAEGYGAQAENGLPLRAKQQDRSGTLFSTHGSRGSNPRRLAQLTTVLDMAMLELGWDDCNFSDLIRDAQASIEGHYHNDYVRVALAEEIQRKEAEKASQPRI